MSRTLYAIGDDLQALDDLLAEVGGEITDDRADAAIDAWLTELAADQANKLEGYYRLIRSHETRAAAAKEEAERATAIARAATNAADRLKARLLQHMAKTGQSRLTTASGHALTLVANGGKEPIEVDNPLDLTAIPPEFVAVVPEQRRLNTDAVREALKAGDGLPWARLGERGVHLRVR